MVHTLGKFLKQYRAEHDLSQENLASILGTTKQVLSNYETGKRSPKITIAAAYSERLGIPLSDMLGETVSPEKYTPRAKSYIINSTEKNLLSGFRELNKEGQAKVLSYTDDLIRTGIYKNQPEANPISQEA